MKAFAPKTLTGSDLRGLMDDLVMPPARIARHLDVSERSLWRWLADGKAPRSVLLALWHETPAGRECSSLDVGNELVLLRALVRSSADLLTQAQTTNDALRRQMKILELELDRVSRQVGGVANCPLWAYA